MSKGWLLFWTALFIGGAVTDFRAENYGSATFELIMGAGIGVNLIARAFKESIDKWVS